MCGEVYSYSVILEIGQKRPTLVSKETYTSVKRDLHREQRWLDTVARNGDTE
jgi:hypothetical protein